MGFARVGMGEFLRDNWFLRFRKLGQDDLPEPARDASTYRPTVISEDE